MAYVYRRSASTSASAFENSNWGGEENEKDGAALPSLEMRSFLRSRLSLARRGREAEEDANDLAPLSKPLDGLATICATASTGRSGCFPDLTRGELGGGYYNDV